MKIKNLIKKRKSSKNGNRFFTSLDMSEIKHQEAIKNSEIKRGKRQDKGNNYISECGCGFEGCFVHGEFDSISQEEFNNFSKNKQKHHK
jgi:thiamine pyrophosphokinase